MIGLEMTVIDAERLAAEAGETAGGDACVALGMNEDAFRSFYDRTSRILWAYLSRMVGDAHAADDLLQEAYFRLLRSGAKLGSDEHRRHYLFRIATNLARDRYRRLRPSEEPLGETDPVDPESGEAARARSERQGEVRAAMSKLRPRERQLLWLAYGEGSSHEEIAAVLGLRASGVRVLLFRARRRLGRLIEGVGRRPDGGNHGGQS